MRYGLIAAAQGPFVSSQSTSVCFTSVRFYLSIQHNWLKSILHYKSILKSIRACSYDPAYRDVSLTDDLASYLFSYKILHCVHMRKRAGPLAEISFEFAEIIGRRDENFSI